MPSERIHGLAEISSNAPPKLAAPTNETISARTAVIAAAERAARALSRGSSICQITPAKLVVNVLGMCCVITVGGQLAGNNASIVSSASTPPVDEPIATTAPFINYHFRVTDIIVPYLGAFIGAAWNDDDITGTLGPQLGVKLFVHEQTFVNLGYRYEWFWDKFERINNESDNGNHIFNIGVGFTWGGSGAGTRRP